MTGADPEVVEVRWLLPDGRGGGTLGDGRRVRIPGVVPGDVVRVRAPGTRRVVDAEVTGWIARSPDRRGPVCPFGAACGGCDLEALGAEPRARALRAALAHAFRVAPETVGWTPSPSDAGWRARIKLTIDGGRLGYRAPRSHTLVEVDVCRIARPEVAALHRRVAAWLAQRGGAGLAAVELRSDGRRAVAAFVSGGALAPDVRAALAELGDVALDGRPLHGDPVLALEVAGRALRAGPASFFQVNLAVNEALVGFVRDAVLSRGAERVLDLYAGIGNLGLPIAGAGRPVTAVEAPGPAVGDLRHNARGLPVDVRAVRVERLDPSRLAFDAVIVDPPRAGAPGVLPRVVRNRPRTLVYVSCAPPNAARDLATIRGYRLVELRGFDLFPNTHHVEAVAVLERA